MADVCLPQCVYSDLQKRICRASCPGTTGWMSQRFANSCGRTRTRSWRLIIKRIPGRQRPRLNCNCAADRNRSYRLLGRVTQQHGQWFDQHRSSDRCIHVTLPVAVLTAFLVAMQLDGKPLKRLNTGDSFRTPGSSQVLMKGRLVREDQFDSCNQKDRRETKRNHADSKTFAP